MRALKAVSRVPVIKSFNVKLLKDAITPRMEQKRRVMRKENVYVDTQKCFCNQQGMEGNKVHMNV